MSRFTIELEGQKEFVYGFDHIFGYFYEIWDNSSDEKYDKGPIEEMSSLYNNLSRSKMAEVMKRYGSKEDHINMVALDLPF
jgi:hypothetical protein